MQGSILDAYLPNSKFEHLPYLIFVISLGINGKKEVKI